MQPIFSRNIDINKMAFLNWRIEENDDILNMLNMADGYMLSAIELAKLCIRNNSDKKADILIFPAFANANHAIELYLKCIICTIDLIMNRDFKVEGNHNIKQLFETAKAKIEKYNGSIKLKDFNTATNELNKYILELFDKINATQKNDKMDFSRYPFSKSSEPHFYVLRAGTVEIDLENFVCQFEKIKEKIESLADFLFWVELKRSSE